jgi:hypothetical protein
MAEIPQTVKPSKLSALKERLTTGVSLLFLLGIAGGIAFFAFTTQWAPVAFALIVWFLCLTFFMGDAAPRERTRVIMALLVSWGADAFLYRLALGNDPGGFRRLVPAIVIVSIYLGYETWRMTAAYTEVKVDWNGREQSNPMAFVAAVLLCIFLMLNVVSPLMNHMFPSYWQRVTAWHFSDDDSPDAP